VSAAKAASAAADADNAECECCDDAGRRRRLAPGAPRGGDRGLCRIPAHERDEEMAKRDGAGRVDKAGHPKKRSRQRERAAFFLHAFVLCRYAGPLTIETRPMKPL